MKGEEEEGKKEEGRERRGEDRERVMEYGRFYRLKATSKIVT